MSDRGDTALQTTTVVVCLPITDRQASFAFYRDGLGLEPLGEPAEDGVPEPLQFRLNEGLRVMLIPAGGFDRITGDRQMTPSGCSECVLTVGANTDEGVQELIHSAHAAGATVVTEAGPQAWGYAGAFADPDGHIWMVRSEGQPA
jgi:predicted lactoylglutathione lyase